MQIGSLADWVTGFATAGSLYLGFTILWRDRRKAEQSEAVQVVAWFVNRPDGNVELSVTNGAGRPIVNATFCLASLGDDGERAARWRILDIAPVLASGEGRQLSIPFADFHANALYPSYIQFRDANGVSWRRNVRSGKLRRTKVGLKWRQHLTLAKSPRRAITYLRVKYHRW